LHYQRGKRKTRNNFNLAHSETVQKFLLVNNRKNDLGKSSYWTERTGIAPYLTKGQQVFVEGSPRWNLLKDRMASQPGAALRLRVREVQLLGSKADTQANAQSNPSQPAARGFSRQNR